MSIYYKIQKYLRIPIPIILKKNLKKYYGKQSLDKQIEKFLNYRNGFFIELGAHDGITQSNTFYYEKNKNWKGILIEPTKHIFEKCIKNRSKKNSFYNSACVSFTFKEKKIKLTYSSLKTFSNEYLDKKLQAEYLLNPEIQRGEKIFTFFAKAQTMNSILKNANAPKIIDFLSLDTEGSEFEVLNGIDFRVYKFKYMLIETNYFNKIKMFLKKKKYKYIKKYNDNDYLFKLQS